MPPSRASGSRATPRPRRRRPGGRDLPLEQRDDASTSPRNARQTASVTSAFRSVASSAASVASAPGGLGMGHALVEPPAEHVGGGEPRLDPAGGPRRRRVRRRRRRVRAVGRRVPSASASSRRPVAARGPRRAGGAPRRAAPRPPPRRAAAPPEPGVAGRLEAVGGGPVVVDRRRLAGVRLEQRGALGRRRSAGALRSARGVQLERLAMGGDHRRRGPRPARRVERLGALARPLELERQERVREVAAGRRDLRDPAHAAGVARRRGCGHRSRRR